jgi:hypothetical protein
VNNACKRKAIDDLFSRPKKIFLKELGQNSANCSNFDDTGIHKIRKNIYAARQSLLPNLPKNIEKVHLAINNMDIKTTSEEQFLLINDDSKNVLIFPVTKTLNFYVNVKIFIAMVHLHTVPNILTKCLQYMALKTDTIYQLYFVF